jgi:hypothetical protein
MTETEFSKYTPTKNTPEAGMVKENGDWMITGTSLKPGKLMGAVLNPPIKVPGPGLNVPRARPFAAKIRIARTTDLAVPSLTAENA